MSIPKNTILDRINREKDRKTGVLKLLDCDAKNLPSEISDLTWLNELYLGGDICNISSISGLHNLKRLDFSETQVADLSPLAGLINLEWLNFSQTLVSNLSPLSGLTKLKTLYFSSTDVHSLRPLERLINLVRINFSETEIADLSGMLGLAHLENITFYQTGVIDLSPLAGLTLLRTIDCYRTQIFDISPLRGLTKLASLDICYTRVTDLSPIWPQIKGGLSVKYQERKPSNGVYVLGCRLVNPPIEFALEGSEAVSEFIEQFGRNRPLLNEVKIIFLGEGASGKTSLIKKLRGEKFDPIEAQTHGIRISKTPFELSDGQIVTANLWDFGGQEVMHAVHQFFLSQRCIYVLVLDSRKDDKAEYWLKHAHSFGDDSPVLVVLNKVDENPSFEVNRKVLREKYPQIREFFRLSCQRGDGIDEFRVALASETAKSPTRCTQFPTTWLAVKEHFANLVKEYDYIDSAEFQSVCIEKGVERKFSQGVLLQFLHDLGVVINFRSLRNFDTQILNPLWLTNGVYRIITSELVARQGGLLYENDFGAVINNPNFVPGNTIERPYNYPPDKLHYVVRVMENFELCYSLDGRRYIVPQLLPLQEPDFAMEGAVLHFIIRFQEFLPDGIFPRLMVKLHPFIKDEFRWRTGMILEKRSVFDAVARVRADKQDRELRIDIAGKEPRRFLSYIRATYKEIAADFPNLRTSEWIPIPESDKLLEYESVIEAENAKEKEMFVWQVKKRLKVADLLDGVEEPAARDEQAQTPVKALVSYSHRDMEHLQTLRAALSPLVRLEKLRLWDDRAIDAGEEWHETIFRELDEADIVLCLISADFINSDFCHEKELKAALEAQDKGEKTVVPIRLRECAWEGLPIAKLQGTPGQWISAEANKDAAWTEVAKSLEAPIAAAKARQAKRRKEQNAPVDR